MRSFLRATTIADSSPRLPVHFRIFIAVLLLLFVPESQARAQGRWTWPVRTPAAAGVHQAVLDSIDREVRAGQYGLIDRFFVVRGGTAIYDRSYRHNYDSIYADQARVTTAPTSHDLTGPYNYFNPWWHPTYRRGDLHSLQSVTKTVTSVVIGTAVMRGDFPSIDTPMLSFFDTTKVRHIDDRKRRVTLRHLLTMSGGFEWNESLPYSDPRNSAVIMEASYDWVTYAVDQPMARDPGTAFRYSSGESQILAHVFRRATGRDIEEYAAEHLFAPLGITRWFWKRTPAGVVDTEGGLYLEASDLARIWQLFLRGGAWNGVPVVSADWVRESVKPAMSVGTAAGGPKYGLKWWLYQNPVDTTRFIWAGNGFGGQLPLAFPDQDMVVVFNAWNIGRQGLPMRRTLERLVKAVR
jgi:CubicO group peptidase (beta-lactamase class C family)